MSCQPAELNISFLLRIRRNIISYRWFKLQGFDRVANLQRETELSDSN